MPSCLRGYFVGPNFFLVAIWSVPESKIFSRGYLWVQNFFWWVFHGSKIFSCVSNFFSWVFRGSSHFFFLGGWFCDSKIFSCWLHNQEWQKEKYKNTSQTMYSFLNRFQQLSIVYIRKVLQLLNHLRYYVDFIYSNYIFRHLFSSVFGSFHS